MKQPCCRCGFPSGLKSKFTDNYYCSNVSDCDRRSNNKLTIREMKYLTNRLEGELGGWTGLGI